jgi:preprotein translocase subunit SecG
VIAEIQINTTDFEMMLPELPLLLGSFGSVVLGWTMFVLSVFLILLILVQRGKGGGLAGALGGPGGQSAFGSKAGDTFTLITAVTAVIWGFVCAVAMYTLGAPPLVADDEFDFDQDPPAITSPDSEPAVPAGEGLGGLSGLSEMIEDQTAPASDEGDDDSPTGTPSVELTPADPPTTDQPSDDSAAEGDASSGESTEDASADDSQPASDDDSGEASSAESE